MKLVNDTLLHLAILKYESLVNKLHTMNCRMMSIDLIANEISKSVSQHFTTLGQLRDAWKQTPLAQVQLPRGKPSDAPIERHEWEGLVLEIDPKHKYYTEITAMLRGYTDECNYDDQLSQMEAATPEEFTPLSDGSDFEERNME